MRILITGLSGFAGRHLIEFLASGGEHEFLGIDLACGAGSLEIGDCKLIEEKADLLDRNKVESIISEFKPQQIYHLAAQSSVSRSWKDPINTFSINVFGGINILESARSSVPDARIIVICTAEEYGELEDGRAIKETDKIYPENPYAISKSAMDFTSMVYHRAYGMNIMVSRSFNHIGPGQSEGFVCSDFARQIALIEAGRQEPEIMVGNLDSSRDFLDVRDVTRAYWHIMERGRPGQAYNVCSGSSVKISRLLEILLSLSKVSGIGVKKDMDKFRPIDIKTVFGDNARLVSDTGWKAEYSLEKSLEDALDWWRMKVEDPSGSKSRR
ncbi:MAG: GDP-mannose 4,6-dehydratase [Actinobacteria bacterium]|nr:GDP-mannose 4,6-dehydratase [Actinomycetota bacterium]